MALLRKKKASNGKTKKLDEFTFASGDRIVLSSKGLIPVVLQDGENNTVVDLVYMDRRALYATVSNKIIHVFKRSMQEVVQFGIEGTLQFLLKDLFVDSRRRSLLMVVEKEGTAEMDNGFHKQVDFTPKPTKADPFDSTEAKDSTEKSEDEN